jgi:protein O-mannosyl-transferase
VLLVYALARRILASTQSDLLPFAIAAIWAVHPLSTEAVTNIVGRADLLAALAVLGGLLMFARSTEAAGGRRFFWLAGLAAITTVGVFAKESAVVVVPVIALYAACVRSAKASRLRSLEVPARFGEARRSAGGAKAARSTARRLQPPANGMRSVVAGTRAFSRALIALALPLLLLWSQRTAVLGAAKAAEFPFVDNPIAGADFWTGRLTALGVMVRYLWLVAWPSTLSADYSFGQIPLASGSALDWLAAAAIAAALAGCVMLWRRHRTAFFFAGFALLTFLPASNLLLPTGTIMAERVMYLPSVGVIALAVISVLALKRDAKFLGPIALCALVGFGIRTWIRNNDWRDDLSLWTATVRTSPDSFKAHRGLAETLYEADSTHANIDRVVHEIERAMAPLESLPPSRSDARTYRLAGVYYLEQGDTRRGDKQAAPPAEAVRAYERSAAALRRCLAIIESRGGDAAADRNTATPAADVYRVLSAVHGRLREHDKAIDAAARALALDPLNVVGYQQAAAAFLLASRGDDAAVTLMTGSLVSGEPALRAELVDLYRNGLDPLGCALVPTRDGPAINAGCATVRRHACAATKEAIDVHARAGRTDQAQRLKDGAARQFQCSW